MKKIAVIFFTLNYLVSTAGVSWSSFYCCGKLKETYIFSHEDYGKGCKKDKKTKGCCETKTFFAKVKDSHSPSTEVKASGADFTKILYPVSIGLGLYFDESYQNKSFALLHAPPLISKQSIYLSVCNLRI